MKIGLALGGGAARGWAHIGVIEALIEKGIEPDIICGTSIGALVGAAYAADNLDKLSNWVRSLSKLETAKFFNINTSFNGFIKKDKLHDFFCQYVADDTIQIENLEKKFASVATDLNTGREVWLQEGKITEAVWASIGLPGLFPPMRYKQNQWLLDGGLVNPVPVSVCKALGADFVIAVNLNDGLLKKSIKPNNPDNEIQTDNWLNKVSQHTSNLFSNDETATPSLFDSIAATINITQDRITKSRIAGEPPDILISPRLAHIGLLEFYRAEEAIDEGINSVKRLENEILHLLN